MEHPHARAAHFAYCCSPRAFFAGCQQAPANSPTTPPPAIEVYFSPKGGCTEAVVKEIDAAKTTILVQAYSSFTSAPIAKAPVQAHKRGVDVRVILDKSQRTERYVSVNKSPAGPFRRGRGPSERRAKHSPGVRTWPQNTPAEHKFVRGVGWLGL